MNVSSTHLGSCDSKEPHRKVTGDGAKETDGASVSVDSVNTGNGDYDCNSTMEIIHTRCSINTDCNAKEFYRHNKEDTDDAVCDSSGTEGRDGEADGGRDRDMEAEVDSFGWEKAMQWLDAHHVSYQELESLEEMIALIKFEKKKKQGTRDKISEDPRPRYESGRTTQQVMQEILLRDEAMKKELSEVYDDLCRILADQVHDDVHEVLETLYGDYLTTIAIYNSKLVNDECPIVVAGETSSGKSSLLNLLLDTQTDVLPHSLLCATSTICRLHNDSRKRFETQGPGSDIQTVELVAMTEAEWCEKLRQCVSSPESRAEHKYKLVDIYWPIPMLQERVTIVDTPGVGESEEMTKRLIKYLPNAVAFIYVINSAMAGGVQEDKLLRIIGTQQQWAMEEKLSYFDPHNAIFVCNQWDRVKASGEEKRVWDQTLEKLGTVLPKLSEDQVFKMSASEAKRFRKSGMGFTDEFQNLLNGIERMVPASLKAKVTMHFRWLEGFLKKLQNIVTSRINNARLSEEEKRQMYDSVMSRLNNLRLGSNRVRAELTQEAESGCLELARRLHQYLNTKEVQDRLATWTDVDAPDIDAGDFDVTKFNAERLIMDRILEELKEWEEQNNYVKNLSECLTRLFTQKCRLLGEECAGVDLAIQGVDTDMQAVEGASQPEMEGKESLFTGSEKIILAVAAPLWIPLVTAATVLFLPVGVGMFIREAVRENRRRKDYMANKVSFMREWTFEITKLYFNEENLQKFIRATYLNRFKEKIEELCDNFIPKQIEADEKQVNLIHNDMRSSREILKQYTPVQKELKAVLGKFYLYDLKYMYKDLIDIKQLQRVREIGKGNFSDVYEVDWIKDGKKQRTALKILRQSLKGEHIYNQLSEVESFRVLRHKNIVEFYGPCYSATGGEDSDSSADDRGFKRSWREQTGGNLMLLLELCEESLEDRIFHDSSLQCRLYSSVLDRRNAFSFYTAMATGICDGLAYIHGRGYLHRDLKLSNVLIKNKTAKISDMGFARHEIALTGTCVGTFSHMSPEILDSKPYNQSTDIYSLAILLLELWNGHTVYSEPEFNCYTTPSLLDVIKSGTRPLLKGHFKMVSELEDLVKQCWNMNPSSRPKAEHVSSELRKLYVKDYKTDPNNIQFEYGAKSLNRN